MPRAKKAPSEVKPKGSKPEATNEPASTEDQQQKGSPVRAMPAAKTTEATGKPVSSVNPQGGNAGVKTNGRGETDLEAAIRARAYEIWERRGRPEGAGHDDWLQAEREILSERDKRTA